jgi:hypothetical protein
VFHLSRPPYFRRFVAASIVVTAIAVELMPPTTEPLALATADIAAGIGITEADVRWVEVPIGLFPAAELPATSTRPVPAGAPVTGFDVVVIASRFPSDWLLIELEVPPSTRDGATVVAVVATDEGPTALPGVVARDPAPSDFGAFTSLVAFPPGDAVTVAAALMTGDVSVLLGG